MALAAGAAGGTPRGIFRSGGARRGMALVTRGLAPVTSTLSITVGVMASIHDVAARSGDAGPS
jgi:hypothetical protein